MTDEQELDISRFDVLALDISAATEKSDVLFLGKDGSYLLCDADCGNGYGEITYCPQQENNEESISIFLSKNGIPKMASCKGRHVYFNSITEDGVDMVLIDEIGNPIFAYNDVVPDGAVFSTSTKASFILWKESWIDFGNSVYHWSWDDDQKKALGAFAWKVVSFAITAYGTLSGTPLDILNAANTAFSEFEKSDKGYGSKTGFFGVKETTSIRGILALADDWHHVIDMPFDYFAEFFNRLSEFELENISVYEKQFSEYFELKDYHLKLKYRDNDYSGRGRNVVNINCSSLEGYFYVTIDTKSQWWFEYDGTDKTGEKWFVVGRYDGNGEEQIVIGVNENQSPKKRSGVIHIKTPGREGVGDAEWYNGTIYLEQGGKNDYFILSPNTLSFPSEGGTQIVKVDKKSDAISDFYEWGVPKWTSVKKENDCFIVSVDEYNDTRKDTWCFYVATWEKNNPYRFYDFPVTIIQGKSDERMMRDALIKLYKDTNGDNWIKNKNWCSDKPINEWEGVAYYEADEFYPHPYCILYLEKNNLVGSISLAGFPVLQLWLEGNDLVSLEIKDCSFLEYLDCENCHLSSLTVNNCASLKQLRCSFNEFSQLDLSTCSSLEYLRCEENSAFSYLNVSGCKNLKKIYCPGNQLEFIDASGCESLFYIACPWNKLSTLILPQNKVLNELVCNNNLLTSIDLSDFHQLEYLDCGSNNLSSLNLNGCANLQHLDCGSNSLSSLNLNGCANLQHLNCGSNSLFSLNLNGYASLQYLDCESNNLSSLNLNGCANLTSIYCSDNQLTSLALNDILQLEELGCSHNQLTSLYIPGNKNKSVDCTYNPIESLTAENWESLGYLSCCQTMINQQLPDCYPGGGKSWHYERKYYYNEDGLVQRTVDFGWWFAGEPEKGYHGR